MYSRRIREKVPPRTRKGEPSRPHTGTILYITMHPGASPHQAQLCPPCSYGMLSQSLIHCEHQLLICRRRI